jgi:uncharacterized phiE125 gp8 family phage protein
VSPDLSLHRTWTIVSEAGPAAEPLAPHPKSPTEPLTVDQGKLAAGLDWAADPLRDQQMLEFISAARTRVQNDTGVALVTLQIRVSFDSLPIGYPVDLPFRPVNTAALVVTDRQGVNHDIDPTAYQLDKGGPAPAPARILLYSTAPIPGELQPLQAWSVVTDVGYADGAALKAAAPDLWSAVALLTAHYATAGRDAVALGTIVNEMPYGYDALIAPYQIVSLM